MFDAFPHSEWSDNIAEFWTFGGQGSTGTWILTVLGFLAMCASLVGWVLLEKSKLEAQAAALRAGGLFVGESTPGPTGPGHPEGV
jgi:hypothetical protein